VGKKVTKNLSLKGEKSIRKRKGMGPVVTLCSWTPKRQGWVSTQLTNNNSGDLWHIYSPKAISEHLKQKGRTNKRTEEASAKTGDNFRQSSKQGDSSKHLEEPKGFEKAGLKSSKDRTWGGIRGTSFTKAQGA